MLFSDKSYSVAWIWLIILRVSIYHSRLWILTLFLTGKDICHLLTIISKFIVRCKEATQLPIIYSIFVTAKCPVNTIRKHRFMLNSFWLHFHTLFPKSGKLAPNSNKVYGTYYGIDQSYLNRVQWFFLDHLYSEGIAFERHLQISLYYEV